MEDTVLALAEYMGAKDDGCISMSGPGHDRCLQDPREPFPTRGHSRSRSDGSRRRLQPHRRPMAPKVPVVNWGRIRGLCRQGRQRLRGHARRVDRQRVASYAMLGGCNASLTDGQLGLGPSPGALPCSGIYCADAWHCGEPGVRLTSRLRTTAAFLDFRNTRSGHWAAI